VRRLSWMANIWSIVYTPTYSGCTATRAGLKNLIAKALRAVGQSATRTLNRSS